MDMPTIGINNYYYKHNTKKSGNSYTLLTSQQLIEAVEFHWYNRKPGAGETDKSRKVVIQLQHPIYTGVCFCGARAKLIEGLPVQTRIEARQAGERPSLVHFVWYRDAVEHGALYEPRPAKVEVVVYSREALSEGNDKPDTDCDWEIVTLLCSSSAETEPMPPLTMARNQLREKGGTYGEYSGLEYAKSIWYHSMRDLKVRYE
jgi:hypothetical protein